MPTNETSDSLPDEPLIPIEPDDTQDDAQVPLPGGVSAHIDRIDALKESDDVAGTDFGVLAEDPDEPRIPQSYVAVDLDQIRADIAAAEASDDPPDPEEALERQAARVEAGYLITHIGRFTHGPESEPLLVGNDDSTIATSMATAKDRIGDIGLTPETVIGRRAHTERTVPDLDLHVRVEAEALNEEILPIVEELDDRIGEGQTPIARLNIMVKPLGPQQVDTDEAERSLSNPSAHATVWVRSGLRSDAYTDTFGMDRETGARVEAFLGRLGFRDAQVLTPDEGEYDDTYYTNTRSEVLLQVNRFMRQLLG